MASRSPSPPPVMPFVRSRTASGSVGHRFTKLQQVHAATLRHTLATNSYANFSSCFPTPAAYCPKALEGVWKQLNTRLEQECTKDFHKLCEERDVQANLDDWDKILDQARDRRADTLTNNDNSGSGLQGKPMHLLTADELYAANSATSLIKAESELKDKLDITQSGNQAIITKVEQQRTEIQQLIYQLQSLVGDINGAAEIIHTNPSTLEWSRDPIEMNVSMNG